MAFTDADLKKIVEEMEKVRGVPLPDDDDDL